MFDVNVWCECCVIFCLFVWFKWCQHLGHKQNRSIWSAKIEHTRMFSLTMSFQIGLLESTTITILISRCPMGNLFLHFTNLYYMLVIGNNNRNIWICLNSHNHQGNEKMVYRLRQRNLVGRWWQKNCHETCEKCMDPMRIHERC